MSDAGKTGSGSCNDGMPRHGSTALTLVSWAFMAHFLGWLSVTSKYPRQEEAHDACNTS